MPAAPNLICNHPKQQLLGSLLQQHLEDHGQGPGGQLELGEDQEEDWKYSETIGLRICTRSLSVHKTRQKQNGGMLAASQPEYSATQVCNL